MGNVVSVAPILSRLTGRLRGTKPIADAAVERIELAPEMVREGLPAIALPDEAERITAAHRTASLEQQLERMRGGPHRHHATVAYRLRNALIADGAVYAGGRYESVAKMKRRAVIMGRCEELDNAQLCGDTGSDLFFGHWLRDSLAKELLAHERGLAALNFPNPLRVHEAGYRELLDLPARLVGTARVRNLWLVDDRGYNADHIRRLRLLRDRLRANVTGSGARYVYLDRGKTGVGRGLADGDVVAEALRRRGFTVIHPETMTAREIARELVGARIAVAVEGSALSHCQVALPAGSAMLTIQPADRFSAAHKTVGEASGLRFGYVVAGREPAGLRVDPERLLRTLDLLEAAL